MDTPRNLIILGHILNASTEVSMDRKFRSPSATRDRIIVLAQLYGKRDRVTKEEIVNILSKSLDSIVTKW